LQRLSGSVKFQTLALCHPATVSARFRRRSRAEERRDVWTYFLGLWNSASSRIPVRIMANETSERDETLRRFIRAVFDAGTNVGWTRRVSRAHFLRCEFASYLAGAVVKRIYRSLLANVARKRRSCPGGLIKIMRAERRDRKDEVWTRLISRPSRPCRFRFVAS